MTPLGKEKGEVIEKALVIHLAEEIKTKSARAQHAVAGTYLHIDKGLAEHTFDDPQGQAPEAFPFKRWPSFGA